MNPDTGSQADKLTSLQAPSPPSPLPKREGGQKKEKGACRLGVLASWRLVSLSACQLVSLILLFSLSLLGCATHLEKGDKFAQKARWDDAVEEYRLASLENPNSTEAKIRYIQARIAAAVAHYEWGVDYKERGDIPRALAEFRRTLIYYPDHVAAKSQIEEAHNQALARIYTDMAKEKRQQGILGEAVRLLKEATLLDPKNQEASKEYKAAQTELEQQREEAQKKAAKGAEALFVSTKPITLRFKDTDIKEVFEIIAKIADVNVIFDSEIQPRRITAHFKDITIREAISLLLQSNKLAVKRINPNTVLIYPDNPQKQQQYMEMITHIFYLQNSEAKTMVNLIRSLLNTKQLHVNESLDAIVMRDTPEKVEIAKKLIEANDLRDAEVEVDMEIMEVNWSKVEKIGMAVNDSITLSATGIYNPKLAAATTAFNEATMLFKEWTSKKIKQTEGIHFTELPSQQLKLTLDLLKSETDSKLLANPKLRIRDGKKGKIHIGERIPIQTGKIFDQSAATQSRITYEYRDVGLKVTVTPKIRTSGEVSFDLNFESSSAEPPLITTGGDVLTTITTRSLDSFIQLRDGETKLLGGLIREETKVTTKKIPFLGDIPLLGRVFQDVGGSESAPVYKTTTLLISITPHIVRRLERPGEETIHFWSGTQDSYSTEAPPQAPPPPTPLSPATEKEAQERLKSTLEVPPPPAAPAPPEKEKPKVQEESKVPAPTPPPAPKAAPAPAPKPVPAPAPPPPPKVAKPVTEPLTILIEPATVSAKVQEAFNLKILIKGAKDMGEVFVTLQYDPKVLNLISIAEEPFMSSGGSKATFISNIDQGRGRVNFGTAVQDKTKGPSGAGSMAVLSFKTLAPGTTNVSLEEILLRNLKGESLSPAHQGTKIEVK